MQDIHRYISTFLWCRYVSSLLTEVSALRRDGMWLVAGYRRGGTNLHLPPSLLLGGGTGGGGGGGGLIASLRPGD